MSEHLPKLRLQMLQYRRDALIELRCILKRWQHMPQIAMIEDDRISTSVEASRYSMDLREDL